MNEAIATAVISAASGLIGAAIGGGTTLISSAKQSKRDTDREESRRKLARQSDAAAECQELCSRIADEMERAVSSLGENHDSVVEAARDERVRDMHKQVGFSALYLPEPLRERIITASDVIRYADEIGYGTPAYGGTHYDRPYTICWHSRKEVREVTAAFLQGKPIPPATGKMSEYIVALRDLDAEKRDFYDSIDESNGNRQASERAMTSFYERHPDLRNERSS